MDSLLSVAPPKQTLGASFLSVNIFILIGCGHSRSAIGSVGSWVMAYNGSAVRRSANLYSSGFLLLLCEEVSQSSNPAQMKLKCFFPVDCFAHKYSMVLVASVIGGESIMRLPTEIV